MNSGSLSVLHYELRHDNSAVPLWYMRCFGRNKDGRRCDHWVSAENLLCHQHLGQAERLDEEFRILFRPPLNQNS